MIVYSYLGFCKRVYKINQNFSSFIHITDIITASKTVLLFALNRAPMINVYMYPPYPFDAPKSHSSSML